MSGDEERRAAPRLCAETLPDGLSGRIRPGHQVRLVNVSRAGALIESTRRLLPGASVELQLELDVQRHASRARVVRCAVSAMRPQVIVFQAALALDSQIPWLQNEAADGES